MTDTTALGPHDPLGLPAEGRIHLIGIGGAGMSALAYLLLERGQRVSGSDLRGGRACTALEAMGAEVSIGHHADHVAGAAVVAVSTAVPADNPEVVAARAAGTPILHRAELLAEVAADHSTLYVAGTHGKTTTTAMAVIALQHAGQDPSFVIGGTLHDVGTSAHHGAGGWMVAETDESDRSLLRLVADCAIVTNVELDHHDTYADLDDLTGVMTRWVAQRRSGAPLIACADDPGAAALAAAATGVVRTYGTSASADVRITDVRTDAARSLFRIHADDADLGEWQLGVPGMHNVRNATAVVAAASTMGVDLDGVRDGLAGFVGAQRRFQVRGTAGGVTVVDDYAHHPTELAAALEGARQYHPDGRVVAVFQPHRYSRTAALGAELGRALSAADLVVVTEIYGAGEAPVPGVSAASVAAAVRQTGTEVQQVGPAGGAADLLVGLCGDGDLVMTMGAGDITELGDVLLERIRAGRG